jgi:hypothetical protein
VLGSNVAAPADIKSAQNEKENDKGNDKHGKKMIEMVK